MTKKKKRIKTKVGRNLPSVLSKTLVKDWYTAVSEFVCNAYDADAEEVHIDINSGLETLVIKDNGEGMDKTGLDNFFRLGDSSKIIEPISPKKKRKRIGRYGIAKVLLRYLGNSFRIESVKDGSLYCVDKGVMNGNVKGHKHRVSKETPDGTTVTILDLRFKVGDARGEFNTKKLQERLQWDIPNKPDFDVFVNGELIRKRGVVEYARVYRVKERIGRHVLKGRIYWRKIGKRDLEGIRIYVNGRAVGDPSMFDLKRISWNFEKRTLGEIHADFLEDIITLDRLDFQEDPRLDKVKSTIVRILNTIKNDLTEGRNRRAFFKDERLYQHVQGALGLAEEQLNKRLENKEYFILELSPPDRSGPISHLNKETKTIYLNAGNKMFAFLSKSKEIIGRKISEVYLKRAFLIAAAHALTNSKEGNGELDELIEEQTALLFRKFPWISSSVNRFIEGIVLTPLKDIYFNKYRLYDSQELSHLTGRPSFVIRSLHASGALKGSEEHLFDKPSIIKTLRPLEKYFSCIEVADKRYQSANINMTEKGLRLWYDTKKATSLDIALASLKDKKALKKFGVINVGKKYPLHFVPIEKSDEFSKYINKNRIYNGN